MRSTIILKGAEVNFKRDNKGGLHRLRRLEVYSHMLLTIISRYPSLPDYRTLSSNDIRFFYNGLRINLKEEGVKAK